MTTLVHEAGMWRRVYERGKLMGFLVGLPLGAAAALTITYLVIGLPLLCRLAR